VAFDGKQAIEAARNVDPDVLIIDLGMPILDGLQVANSLREMPEFAQKVFIALTGYADQRHLDQASQARFDEYLIKPFKFETLLAILQEAASRS
jgi:CheY-like chemotaxis protein